MNKTKKVIRVGISDLNIVQSPDLIRTSGLGSCVGVVVYDLRAKIGGMAHVMLPDSSINKQKELNVFKFADTAIPYLVEKLCAKGAKQILLKAKLAGGAQMFQFETSTDVMRIGPRNIEAVKGQLAKYNIPIIASDLGGSAGRTIEFDPDSGNLAIRKVNEGEYDI